MKSQLRILALLLLCLCLGARAQEMDLSGTWRFAIDRNDQGVTGQWFLKSLDDRVTLPGSMMTNGKGNPVNLDTPWEGDFNDKTFFTQERYAPYRRADNFKIPYWLQPNLYYAGVAWYQRDVTIPDSWAGKSIRLYLERCHWVSRVWVDGKEAGKQDALSAPHWFDLTPYLTPGKHTLSIRVDNAIRDVDPGVNSHSVSDHTQGNWNGIAGTMLLKAQSPVAYRQVNVYPQLEARRLDVKAYIYNNGVGKTDNVTIGLRVDGEERTFERTVQPGDNLVELSIPLPADVKPWDEFTPNLYRLECTLSQGGEQTDARTVTFGCRTWSVKDGQLTLNGHPVFMRGTLHCAAFPLTGYPATDKEEWLRELRVCRSYGINHIRFHSWCPPEAAFQAADELGMYFVIECSSWANQSTTIGDGKPIDEFIHREAQAIVDAFGNHPSFCMMAYGNEPGGENQAKYLTDFVSHWKQADPRRLYTSAAGWPNLPVNDFLSDQKPRIQQWGAGLTSLINAEEPTTDYDWRDYTGQFTQPIISHEIGQWCVYPNFKEIEKYTGVYKARNFEIFRDNLAENGLAQLADSFLLASGKLQTLCYKADIEAALRTPKFGGFQLLGLNDFPGQGTALVGALDVFWEEKGYATPRDYSRFCSSVVPLARIPKLILTNAETFSASVEAANFYKPMEHPEATWRIRDDKGQVLSSGTFDIDRLTLGNCQTLGNVSFNLNSIHEATRLNLEVGLAGHYNDWNFWVYPAEQPSWDKPLMLTDRLDSRALARLQAGGKVLLSLRKGTLRQGFGGEVAIGFSSIFWNTAWTNGQPPHTLGILCDPKHPALHDFPTAYHSDYQWWDAMTHSGAINVGKLSKDIRPLVRVIDDWVTNRPLALLFEVKVGKGKLLVSGIDFHQDMEHRPAARQLLYSLGQYMQSEDFNPAVSLTAQDIRKMMK